MINIFPRRNFVIISGLPPQSVANVLRQNAETGGKNPLRLPNGKFNGIVTDWGFELQRNIFIQNSFLPVVRGSITPDGAGSRVDVDMRLYGGTQAFMVLFLLALVFVLGGFMKGDFMDRLNILYFMGLISAALLLGAHAAFHDEARKAEQFLRGLLEEGYVRSSGDVVL